MVKASLAGLVLSGTSCSERIGPEAPPVLLGSSFVADVVRLKKSFAQQEKGKSLVLIECLITQKLEFADLKRLVNRDQRIYELVFGEAKHLCSLEADGYYLRVWIEGVAPQFFWVWVGDDAQQLTLTPDTGWTEGQLKRCYSGLEKVGARKVVSVERHRWVFDAISDAARFDNPPDGYLYLKSQNGKSEWFGFRNP